MSPAVGDMSTDPAETRQSRAEGLSFNAITRPLGIDAARLRRPLPTGIPTISYVPSRGAHILGHEEVPVCYTARSRASSPRSH